MDKHITILGVLYVAISLIYLLTAGIVLLVGMGLGVFGGILGTDAEALLASGIVLTVAFFLGLFSLPGLIGGVGLPTRARWSRIVVLVLAVLNICSFPMGTLLSVYTLWVLLQSETDYVFRPRYGHYA